MHKTPNRQVLMIKICLPQKVMEQVIKINKNDALIMRCWAY